MSMVANAPPVCSPGHDDSVGVAYHGQNQAFGGVYGGYCGWSHAGFLVLLFDVLLVKDTHSNRI